MDWCEVQRGKVVGPLNLANKAVLTDWEGREGDDSIAAMEKLELLKTWEEHPFALMNDQEVNQRIYRCRSISINGGSGARRRS